MAIRALRRHACKKRIRRSGQPSMRLSIQVMAGDRTTEKAQGNLQERAVPVTEGSRRRFENRTP